MDPTDKDLPADYCHEHFSSSPCVFCRARHAELSMLQRGGQISGQAAQDELNNIREQMQRAKLDQERKKQEAEKLREMAARESQRIPDPWAHRSQGMRCKSCMWFVPKVRPKSGILGVKEPESYDLGRCRRHAPTMNGFPAVFVNDWCGDHKLDEEKL